MARQLSNNVISTPYVKLWPDAATSDAFARLRVSEPTTVFDSKQLHDKLPLFWDEEITNTSGNATSTHSTTNAETVLHVETGDTIIRQTKTQWNYQPGKSQLCIYTGRLTSAGNLTGVTARIGSFTADDGLFFESDSDTIYVCQRKAASDTRVAQSNWNIDPFDGTGPSGATLHPSKCQIMFLDFEWLGVGRVRMGFFVNGVPYYCHEFLQYNQYEAVYMSTPNLPVRYEISSTDSSADLHHICSSIISEGGIQENGVIHSFSNGATATVATTADTIYGVIGVRLKSTHLDVTGNPIKMAMMVETANDDFEWLLLMNPTVAGSPTFANLTNSAMQTVIGATANVVTANSWDVQMDGGYATTSQPTTTSVETALKWGSKIDGTPDEIWLCIRPLQANTNAYGSLTWRELL